AIAFDLDLEEQRVVIAVGGGRDYAQPVAAGLALHPQLAAGPAPEGDIAALERLLVADFVEKAQHQDLTGLGILHHSRNQTVHLGKVDRYRVHRSSSLKYRRY